MLYPKIGHMVFCVAYFLFAGKERNRYNSIVMKEIKTNKYLNKEAQEMPIGDPGLPAQMTERDIPEASPELGGASDSQGESEISVDWQKFSRWFSTGGEQLPEVFSKRPASTTIWISYRYDYDYNGTGPSNIRILYAKDYARKSVIADRTILEAIGSFYEAQIASDIEMSEEDNNLQRQTNYNPNVE